MIQELIELWPIATVLDQGPNHALETLSRGALASHGDRPVAGGPHDLLDQRAEQLLLAGEIAVRKSLADPGGGGDVGHGGSQASAGENRPGGLENLRALLAANLPVGRFGPGH